MSFSKDITEGHLSGLDPGDSVRTYWEEDPSIYIEVTCGEGEIFVVAVRFPESLIDEAAKELRYVRIPDLQWGFYSDGEFHVRLEMFSRKALGPSGAYELFEEGKLLLENILGRGPSTPDV